MSKLLLSSILILICGISKTAAMAHNTLLPAGGLLKDSAKRSEKKHSPHRASVYSAVLPGLGQAYNEKYWKIPVIYAALGTSAYFMVTNRTEMRRRQVALTAMLDDDSSTMPEPALARFSTSVLKAERNLYRTNRDYSIIAFAAFYMLNIIDAAVDAHFYKFNIDKPLAARKEKNWHLYSGRMGGINTVGLSWHF